MKVVIVEPDNLWRGLLFRYLDHSRGTFLFAPDAVTAHRAIMSHNPNLMVTELNLPDYSGLELIRKVRRSAFNHLKILVLSQDTNRETLEQLLALGTSAYIEKSSTRLVDIAAIITSVLNSF